MLSRSFGTEKTNIYNEIKYKDGINIHNYSINEKQECSIDYLAL